MPEPEQNRLLNGISLSVDQDLRQTRGITTSSQALIPDTIQAMRDISRNLDSTWTAFKAQIRRRNQLVQALQTRIGIREALEYEMFFLRYFGQLNDEKFQFEQIRAITEGPLYNGNQQILNVLKEHPQVFAEIPALTDLQQHLVFWLNKYEKVFVRRPEMCLLYTGVEDGVPFPRHIEGEVERWIEAHG